MSDENHKKTAVSSLFPKTDLKPNPQKHNPHFNSWTRHRNSYLASKVTDKPNAHVSMPSVLNSNARQRLQKLSVCL